MTPHFLTHKSFRLPLPETATPQALQMAAACLNLASRMLDDGDDESAAVVVQEGLAACRSTTPSKDSLLNLNALLALTSRFGNADNLQVLGHTVSLSIAMDATDLVEPREGWRYTN